MLFFTQKNVIEMTPTEFEQYTVAELNKQFDVDGIQNYSFKHNVKKNADDGIYQIDGEIKFTLMGVNYDTLVECKHYSNPVERKEIQVLYDKIRATGAQKGIFVTTSSFQSGAIKYATKHGIALVSIEDGKMQYHTRSMDPQENILFSNLEGERSLIMVLQVYLRNGSIGKSFLNHSNALLDFITI